MKRTKPIRTLIALTAVLTAGTGFNLTAAQATRTWEEALAQWRAMKFGMFIHWGPVSLKGTEIGWSRGRQVPIQEYDRLYLRFNPTNFNARSWVRIAKDAGMRYLVITSKHHDGFCLWDSAYTDYDIMATPFHRDVLAELSAGCRAEGIRFGTYYSILDWWHPDYPLGSPGGKSKKPHPNMERYVQYVFNQTTELVKKYGPLFVMWFDGQWEKPWKCEYGNALYRHLRRLQPDIIINNRINKHQCTIRGDFDTPEQRIGRFNRTRPWESCITLGRQWAWRPHDRLKSFKQCLEILIRTVGGDGNLLLNVGPMPDGRIEPRQVQILRQIGRWLRKYGEGIYGTRGGPFLPGQWGASTCKGHHIYLFLLQPPKNGQLVLPKLPMPIQKIEILSGESLRTTATPDGKRVLHIGPQKQPVTVLRIQVQGDAFQIPPQPLPQS